MPQDPRRVDGTKPHVDPPPGITAAHIILRAHDTACYRGLFASRRTGMLGPRRAGHTAFFGAHGDSVCKVALVVCWSVRCGVPRNAVNMFASCKNVNLPSSL